MKQKVQMGIWSLVFVVCLGALMIQCYDMSTYSRRVGVCTQQNFSVGQVKEYQKKNSKNGLNLTAWRRKTVKNIRNAKRTQTQQAEFYVIYGAMNEVFPGQMLYGNYPYQADKKGCLISSGLAQKLYGAENILGQTIRYKDRKWFVRGVIKEEKSLLAVTNEKRAAAMTYLVVTGEKNSPVHSMQQITAQIGITDISYLFDGSLIYAVARLLFGLPCFFLLWRLRARTNRQKIIWWAFLCMGLTFFVRIPDSLIPSKWSDFDFWSRQFQELRENWEQWRHSTDVYWETQLMQKLGRMLESVGVACVLGFRLSGVWRRRL